MQEALERALADRDPDNPDLRDTAAACLDGLASAKIAMGDRQGALSDYKESVALTRKLADEQQDVEYQRQLVTSLIHYGDVILKLGDLAGAEAAYKESVAIARKVVRSTMRIGTRKMFFLQVLCSFSI